MGYRRAGSARQKIAYPRRGELYLVAFDPTVGTEIRKIRPAVIIQNDVANRVSSITIVAAVTSQTGKRSSYVSNVPVTNGEGGLTVPSLILTNQIRSVDKQRLIRRLGILHPDTMVRVDRALAISVGLIKLEK